MPLQEAKLSTNLRMRFRTRQTNGILFLAAGRTDYCLLSVDDGRVKLNLKINEHSTEVIVNCQNWVRFRDLIIMKRNIFIKCDNRYGRR